MDDAARQLEHFKAQLQAELKRFEAQLEDRQAAWQENAIRDRERWLHELRTLHLSFRAIIDFALVTVRGLVLVNGGAIVGILSFASSLWSRNDMAAKAMARALGPAITWFVIGLSLALLTAGLSYVAQAAYTELTRPQPAMKVGNRIRAVAVAFAILSLVAFIVGAYESIAAFKAT